MLKAFSNWAEGYTSMTWSDDIVTIHSSIYICLVSLAHETFSEILMVLISLLNKITHVNK